MKAPVTVIIPSIPERGAGLAHAIASVYAQTCPVEKLLVEVSPCRPGGLVDVVNGLATLVDSDWLMVLCDDDTLAPPHLEAMIPHMGDADVVYASCTVVGRSGWGASPPFDPERLRRHNFIPGQAAAIRTSLWRRIGGFHPVVNEDWDLWLRAVDVGARFARQPVPTWTYRFHDTNMSLGKLPGTWQYDPDAR